VLRSIAFRVLICTLALVLGAASLSPTSAHPTKIFVPPGWPKQVVIPSIGVNAPVESLALNRPQDTHAPYRWGDVAWYDLGPKPGQPGFAQIYGHVDSTCCPAVFYLLKNLHPGDIIDVRYRDGRIVRFSVKWQAVYWNNQLPTKWMYQNTKQRGILLITCTGVFHFDGSGYDHKRMVFATAVP